MGKLACFSRTIFHNARNFSRLKLACLSKSTGFLVVWRVNPFWIELFYFILLSFAGFLSLIIFKPTNTTSHSFHPRNLDMFFTSVSATTVSSMSTVEMEVFSNSQLIILTILMFTGGEVFTSMVGLFFKRLKLSRIEDKVASLPSFSSGSRSSPPMNTIITTDLEEDSKNNLNTEICLNNSVDLLGSDRRYLKYCAIKFLGYVVLGYLVVIHVVGFAMVSIYLALVSSAGVVLKNKGLKMLTFSVFTIVSTFASCGFIPTNENMVVFRKNSGLLLMLIPQVLLGNTLLPSCLRFSIWFLGKGFKKLESNASYVLKNTREIGYLHLVPRYSWLLAGTVFGFIVIQFIVFSSMEWNSNGLSGMNSYEKTVGILFQTVNSRHTGEIIVDLSAIAPAILVLFVVMMYLPPYATFVPTKDDEQHLQTCETRKSRMSKLKQNLIFSQLSYVVIFIIIVCITERKKIKEDPLNFNVLNIVVEVISAYGNVGFTTGYSCKRQLEPQSNCVDKWYGFVGKWSDEGKIILILVMFFGRLKKFNMDGGKAWKLHVK